MVGKISCCVGCTSSRKSAQLAATLFCPALDGSPQLPGLTDLFNVQRKIFGQPKDQRSLKTGRNDKRRIGWKRVGALSSLATAGMSYLLFSAFSESIWWGLCLFRSHEWAATWPLFNLSHSTWWIFLGGFLRNTGKENAAGRLRHGYLARYTKLKRTQNILWSSKF